MTHLPPDDDLGFCILAAVRYAMGRRTYAPMLVCNTVKRYWSDLSANTRFCIHRDVTEEIATAARAANTDWKPLGDACDVETWIDLAAWMEAQK